MRNAVLKQAPSLPIESHLADRQFGHLVDKSLGRYDTTAIPMKTLLKRTLLVTLMNETLHLCFFTFTVVS